MRNKTKTVGTAIVAVATAGILVATATNALATPGNCAVTFPSANYVSSLCTTGTGHHRVHMILDSSNPEAGRTAVMGDWASVGQYSTARYPSWNIVTYWTEVSNT
ncbi:hypothetical protein [Actinocrispum wychmicini]|uniref:Secreted protein n=1 Tax=Actinocrispum wychmicini TaxID=1213861 RepID=A0A4V2S7E6_9PSEU|nr:hypothetical protein [Actinocrispum wychmicini]TCO59500.1 hypothetical protein EV192_104342 [Actinocrispum wychmicini]